MRRLHLALLAIMVVTVSYLTAAAPAPAYWFGVVIIRGCTVTEYYTVEATACRPTHVINDPIKKGENPTPLMPLGIPGKDGLCPWIRDQIPPTPTEIALQRLCPQDPPHFD